MDTLQLPPTIPPVPLVPQAAATPAASYAAGSPTANPVRGKRIAAAALALALLGGGAIGGAGAAFAYQHLAGSSATSEQVASGSSTQTLPWNQGLTPNGSQGGTGSSGTLPGQGSTGSVPQQQGGTGAIGGVTGSTTEATASQVRGVVDIVSTLDFGSNQSAGTGIILTSSGRILTNNHVVEGSTSIQVTDLSTGRKYTAKVVGTSPTNDIAVLQLADASGLTTAALGTSSGVAVGDAVVGVGNAGNEAGTSASSGEVTALGESITAADAGGGNAENLTGLIETSAPIQAGDSGGPLLDADGKVVGIETAAQTSRRGTTTAGYAIPIDHALSVAQQIVSGVDDETVHQGVPAFLGVSLQRSGVASGVGSGNGSNGSAGSTNGAATGAVIAGAVADSAAARAGLAAGDVITSFDGQAIGSAEALSAAVAAHDPGDKVTVGWTSTDGSTHTATVTLGEGPAD
jgi:S1-C subfamily serine protease